MKNTDRLKELSDALDDLAQSGHTTVPVYGLKKFITESFADESDSESLCDEKRRAHELSLEAWKMDCQYSLEQSRIQSSSELEMFKATIEAGGSALKAAMLLNGGAAIALLTFLGNAWAKFPDSQRGDLFDMNRAMLWFFVGTATAGAAYLARYITQFWYQLEWHKAAYAAHGISLTTGALSLVAFVVGGINASDAFQLH